MNVVGHASGGDQSSFFCSQNATNVFKQPRSNVAG
jgi:hypothetical protein